MYLCGVFDCILLSFVQYVYNLVIGVLHDIRMNTVIMKSQKSRVDCFYRNNKNYLQYVVNLYKIQYRIGKLRVYSRVLVFLPIF